MTDKECLNWLQDTKSGLYYCVNGLGPAWTVTSVPDGRRLNYPTCREAITETAKRFPTKESLDMANKEYQEYEP